MTCWQTPGTTGITRGADRWPSAATDHRTFLGCRERGAPYDGISEDETVQRRGELVVMFGDAVGWTQHRTGVQMIRAGAIVQLLLGNVGRPGGGVMAMRGHASIQGSSDIPTLYDLLPG